MRKCLILFMISVLLFSCSSEKFKITKPNIIYIMADDMGYGDLGCYGQKKILTPNIDCLADEGIRFTNHYAGTSVCAPSRCVLLTGLHTGHSVVRGNAEVDPYGQFQIPDKTLTVAELLKMAGYGTGLFGKWGLGVENTPGDPQKQGFDEFYGYYCQVHAHNSFPEYLYHNGRKEMLDNEVVYKPKDDWTRGLGSYATKKVNYSNDLIAERAMEYVKQNHDRPFFLYLSVTMPHDNGEAPEGERLEIPSTGIYSDSSWSIDDQRYAAMISRLDEYIGKLTSLLRELKIDNKTLILLTSDNGGFRFSELNHNGLLRGIKRDLYEGGIRVPLIGWWPGSIAPGTISRHISAFWDFLPTACELAGIEVPENIDGISYLPTLMGKEQQEHDFMYWEFHEQGKKQAVRKGKWKGIRLNVFENPDSQIELYNLDEDPGETNDISIQHPDVVKQIEEIMLKAHSPDPNWPLFNREVQ